MTDADSVENFFEEHRPFFTDIGLKLCSASVGDIRYLYVYGTIKAVRGERIVAISEYKRSTSDTFEFDYDGTIHIVSSDKIISFLKKLIDK